MGAQYGVANNNISADKVQSVQVLENHQAVKSLRGLSFSDNAALNIVLKDDAKAVWSALADVGLGHNGDELIYDSRVMGMRFNKSFQTLMMYKNNNMGQMLDNEVLDLMPRPNARFETESGILSLMRMSVPDLDQKRYTFNRSHLMAGNWLWKTGPESELRLQANGLMDETSLQNYASTTYLTLADKPVYIEEQDVCNTLSQWKCEANYKYNGRKTYLQNNLRGYVDYNKSLGAIRHNEQMTDIAVKPRRRSLVDDFSLSHTTDGGNIYKVDSYWGYNYLPGQLLTINGNTERLNLRLFKTQNDLSFRYRIGRHYLNNNVGADYDYQSLSVAMDDSPEQAVAYKLMRVYWKPSMSLMLGRHRLQADAKLSYVYQSYKLSHGSHLWIDPSLSWNYSSSSVSDFSAIIRYSHAPLMACDIYDTPVFTTYRTVRVNRGETDAKQTMTASIGYKYSNPVNGFFLNIFPTYSCTAGNILYKNHLTDNVFSSAATEHEYSSHRYGVSGRVSKALSWAKAFIGLGFLYNISDYRMLISDEVNDGRMRDCCLAIDYSLRPLRHLSVEGKSMILAYKQENLTHPNLSAGSTAHWQHYLNLNIIPLQKFMITLKNELFTSNEKNTDVNYFLDLTLCYRAKRWETVFIANNLIGTSRSERQSISNTIKSYSVTRLRPREIMLKLSVDL